MNRGTVVAGILDPGKWSACFGLSYSGLMLYDAGHHQRMFQGGPSQIRLLTGTGALVAHRNKVAASFLDNTPGEWLFMVDSDMGFAPDTIDRLMASADRYARPVMGGLAFQLKRHRTARADFAGERFAIAPTLFEFLEMEDEAGFAPLVDYPRDSVVKVAGTGAACLLVHRNALGKIRAEHGDHWFTPLSHPTGDRGKPREFSEDLSFCVRLSGAGIPLHVDTGVKTTHDKGGIFLDEAEYDRYRLTEAASVDTVAILEPAQ